MDDGSWAFMVSGWLSSWLHTWWFPYMCGAVFGVIASPLVARALANEFARSRPPASRSAVGLADVPLGPLVAPPDLSGLPLEWRERIENLELYKPSLRDDFDMVFQSWVLRTTMSDDGFSIWPILHYRNRSMVPLHIKTIECAWALSGVQVEAGSSGFVTPVGKESSASVTLKKARVYNDKPRDGSVRLALLFSRDGARPCLMDVQIKFCITGGFPESKMVDKALEPEQEVETRYWVYDDKK